MAICLHKLVGRVSAINPILNQSRQLWTPSIHCLNQIHSHAQNMPHRMDPISKANLLIKTPPTFSQQTAFLSNTTTNFNEASEKGGGDNLTTVYETLRKDLPAFFSKSFNYRNVHKDIVFENRIHGKTHHGVIDYAKQMTYLRYFGHLKYAFVQMDVLKMTKHTEDSSIKVRWRITGISGYRLLFKMIQFRKWRPKQMAEQHQQVWIDGFSTFYVNDDGYIVRHIADKMMPDEEKEPNPIEKVVD